MAEKIFRNKIQWFTFIFSILVVWIHSYNSELFLGRSLVSDRVYRLQHFWGEIVAQVAVPGFFMISAYLFYRNFNLSQLKRKWFSRAKSVLVPFLLWNFIYYLGYVISSRLPVLTEVVNKGVIPFTLQTAVDAVINYTYNYVFWYLYQLILLILLAPLLYRILIRPLLAALFFPALFGALQFNIFLPVLNLDALIYYSAAAFAALHFPRWVEGEMKGKNRLRGTILFLGAAAVYTLLKPRGPGDPVTALVIYRLIVPLSLWMIIDGSGLPEARIWMKSNFFFYAVHFAFVRLINKTGARIFPSAPIIPVLFYVLMPFVVAGISYFLSIQLKKRMPVFWRLLNGGR